MFRDFGGRDPRRRSERDEEIRVTDRRRIQIHDSDSASSTEEIETPNLKPSYVEELEARTNAAEQKVKDVQSRFEQLRRQLQTETDETRQRLNKAADERALREKINFIASLLPVLDSLERASESAVPGASIDDIAEGVRQTRLNFENALAASGLEPIESVGQTFDPEFHEAVETAEVDEENEGKILAEYSRGYRIGERLLRPARVKVGRHRERASNAR